MNRLTKRRLRYHARRVLREYKINPKDPPIGVGVSISQPTVKKRYRWNVELTFAPKPLKGKPLRRIRMVYRGRWSNSELHTCTGGYLKNTVGSYGAALEQATFVKAIFDEYLIKILAITTETELALADPLP